MRHCRAFRNYFNTFNNTGARTLDSTYHMISNLLWSRFFVVKSLNFINMYAALLWKSLHTHYYNSNLIWRTVSRRVDEVIPSDHQRREASSVIQRYDLIRDTWYTYARSRYYYNKMFIVYPFPTLFWFCKLFWHLIQKKCGNVCHYVSFLDVTSSCFPSLVPCLKFTWRNVAANTGNRR